MTGWYLPWADICVMMPLLGAGVVMVMRNRSLIALFSLVISVLTLLVSVVPWILMLVHPEGPDWDPGFLFQDEPLFEVDAFSAPMLPLVALLHTLVVLGTPRTKATRFSYAGHLVAESLRLATFACREPRLLVILLVLCTLPTYVEIRLRGRPSRIFALHMLIFSGLLVVGWLGQEMGASWAPALLMAAVLVRSGTVPAHLWVADLFEQDSFGSALLFAAPLMGFYAAVRLVLPIAPDWVLQGIGLFSLLTAVYAAGMALVQREARRFFSYLFLSNASFVLVGLELHTLISLTGALCMWVSVALSLSGLGLVLRSLEGRYGPLSLTHYRGLYEQCPALAVSFLLAGLASVGFPGTVGFVAADMLVEGAVLADPMVGVGLVLAGAVNGIAILRVYFLLFTGTRRETMVPLGITLRERVIVLVLAGLILGGGLAPQPGISDRHAAAEDLLRRRDKELGLSSDVNPGH